LPRIRGSEVEMIIRSTTILAVRNKGKAAVAGDGQVSLNNTIIKHNAKKVRRIYNNKIIVGFAGATADALNLSERLEKKLGDIGCICCLNKGWYSSAMRDCEGQRFISMHHVEGRTQSWAHAKQLPLCQFHHQTPPPADAPSDLFPLHGNAISVWEKINGKQQDLLKQVYAMIGEERPWINEEKLTA